MHRTQSLFVPRQDTLKKIGNLGKLIQGQHNVGDENKYPEFEGNVKTVDTRPYWQPPRSYGVFKCKNAEVYMEVGDAMGRAMENLLDIE